VSTTGHSGLPAHYELTWSQFVFSAVSIVVAFVLLAAVGYRTVSAIDVRQWWVPLAVVAGMTAADFLSGVIHWAADTWGRDDYPVIGHRLLVPFRVHHVNPDDLLRRRFVDANGDVAFLTIPVLVALGVLPLDRPWSGPVTIFGLAFCGIGSLTNQIHQWAHMPRPPRVVRALQAAGLLLGPAEHTLHHARPYDCCYCITTGWCNRPLEAIRFFRVLEAAVTRMTGVAPRHDERHSEARLAPLAGHE
jgi:plasmanylethanolamine desaturase